MHCWIALELVGCGTHSVSDKLCPGVAYGLVRDCADCAVRLCLYGLVCDCAVCLCLYDRASGRGIRTSSAFIFYLFLQQF